MERQTPELDKADAEAISAAQEVRAQRKGGAGGPLAVEMVSSGPILSSSSAAELGQAKGEEQENRGSNPGVTPVAHEDDGDDDGC